MIFADRFTVLEKIELLQRSILVNSYAYYRLDENVLSDYQYDNNTRALRRLKQEYPEEYSKSKYFEYFMNFESGTCYDLLGMVEKSDQKLFNRITTDAALAMDIKKERRKDII